MSNSLQPHGLKPAHQTPLFMEFSRQEYWNKLPFPPPGDPSNPGIEPTSPISPALAGRFFTTSTTWEAPTRHVNKSNVLMKEYIFKNQEKLAML